MAKTVLITGCSSGIGRATAQYFQARGWQVAATMRTPEIETELTRHENVLVTHLDVTDETSIANALETARNRFGSLDVLVNNAGYGAFGTLESFDMDGARQQFETNVFGVLAATKAVLPIMREAGAGIIVNVSSMGGRVAFPLGTLYHGTKFAIEGISEALHYELAPLGIRLKVVAPGMVATEFGGRSLDYRHDEALTGYQPVLDGLTALLSRVGQETPAPVEPADVAAVIWTAVTDGMDRLRYTVGADAAAYKARRDALGDQGFIDDLKRRMGL